MQSNGVDCTNIVVHFDCDAFYAQCEEIRDPRLRTRPLGVTQKYLIVTCNYPARQQGVAKLMSIREAQQICPSLILVNGEDLTPYRKFSKQVLAILQRFGTAEKLGMDEVLVDVTEEVQKRILCGTAGAEWVGHVHKSSFGVVQENRHRVMDLRAGPARAEEMCSVELLCPDDLQWKHRLMVGTQIAAEARAAVKAEVGFRSSAGIACNRMLAKLCSGLHKPDDQTALPPPEAADFVGPLPLRAIPGVGTKLGSALKEMGLETVEDLRPWSREHLAKKFGDRIGASLFLACRGLDPAPVQAKQPPKAVTVEDSFKSCTSLRALQHVLHILAPDLLARLQEEFQDGGRRPKLLTLKWRHKQNGWSRQSASCPMPPAVKVCLSQATRLYRERPSVPGQAAEAATQVHEAPNSVQAQAVVDAALALFTRNNSATFILTLVNLGATSFEAREERKSVPPAFARLLKPSGSTGPISADRHQLHLGVTAQAAGALTHARRNYGSAPAGPPISKTLERLLREKQDLTGTPSCAGEAAIALHPAMPALVPAPAAHRLSDAACSRTAVLDGAKTQTATTSDDFCHRFRHGSPVQSDEVHDAPTVSKEDGPGERACLGLVAARQPCQGQAGSLQASCSAVTEEATTSKGPSQEAMAEELRRIKEVLRSKPCQASLLDPDVLFARKLQQQELGITVRVPGIQKRAGSGPLDNFVTRTKRSKD